MHGDRSRPKAGTGRGLPPIVSSERWPSAICPQPTTTPAGSSGDVRGRAPLAQSPRRRKASRRLRGPGTAASPSHPRRGKIAIDHRPHPREGDSVERLFLGPRCEPTVRLRSRRHVRRGVQGRSRAHGRTGATPWREPGLLPRASGTRDAPPTLRSGGQPGP